MSCLPGENSAELSRLDVSNAWIVGNFYRRLGFGKDQETSLTIEPSAYSPLASAQAIRCMCDALKHVCKGCGFRTVSVLASCVRMWRKDN